MRAKDSKIFFNLTKAFFSFLINTFLVILENKHRVRLELTNTRVAALCLSRLATGAVRLKERIKLNKGYEMFRENKVSPVGFEPTIFGLEGLRKPCKNKDFDALLI